MKIDPKKDINKICKSLQNTIAKTLRTEFPSLHIVNKPLHGLILLRINKNLKSDNLTYLGDICVSYSIIHKNESRPEIREIRVAGFEEWEPDTALHEWVPKYFTINYLESESEDAICWQVIEIVRRRLTSIRDNLIEISEQLNTYC